MTTAVAGDEHSAATVCDKASWRDRYCFLALAGIPLPSPAGEVVIWIASVVDGDTIELYSERIRL